jgi:hypothetical protein
MCPSFDSHTQNPGPSFIRDGSCNFTLPKGVKSDVWSSSKYFTCVKDETKRTGGLTMLNCVIEELPPADTEFNLSLKLEDITLEDFAIAAECEMKSPEVSFKKEFEAYVGIVPSPSRTPLRVLANVSRTRAHTLSYPLIVFVDSAAPSGSVPAPDNSMMVVVTVIVAVGLLIVIAIWWRRRCAPVSFPHRALLMKALLGLIETHRRRSLGSFSLLLMQAREFGMGRRWPHRTQPLAQSLHGYGALRQVRRLSNITCGRTSTKYLPTTFPTKHATATAVVS